VRLLHQYDLNASRGTADKTLFYLGALQQSGRVFLIGNQFENRNPLTLTRDTDVSFGINVAALGRTPVTAFSNDNAFSTPMQVWLCCSPTIDPCGTGEWTGNRQSNTNFPIITR
jgi:hypothetical protein